MSSPLFISASLLVNPTPLSLTPLSAARLSPASRAAGAGDLFVGGSPLFFSPFSLSSCGTIITLSSLSRIFGTLEERQRRRRRFCRKGSARSCGRILCRCWTFPWSSPSPLLSEGAPPAFLCSPLESPSPAEV